MVKCLVHAGEMKQRLNSDGYPTVTAGSKYAKRTNVRVHRFVALCFVDNPDRKPEVNHIDGNKQNNHYTNLEWATRQEQMVHAFKLGLREGSKGETNGRAKLSEPDVREIRNLYEQDKLTISEIARRYGIGWTTVNHILKNETWVDVKI